MLQLRPGAVKFIKKKKNTVSQLQTPASVLSFVMHCKTTLLLCQLFQCYILQGWREASRLEEEKVSCELHPSNTSSPWHMPFLPTAAAVCILQFFPTLYWYGWPHHTKLSSQTGGPVRTSTKSLSETPAEQNTLLGVWYPQHGAPPLFFNFVSTFIFFIFYNFLTILKLPGRPLGFYFIFIFIYLAILGLSCSMWDLVTRPGI